MIQQHQFYAFGEILWDVFPDFKTLGGAPFNVIAHLNQMGLEPSLISSIGEDVLGNEIEEYLKNHKISTDYIFKSKDYPTGIVQVTLDQNGKPSYLIKEDAAWDHIPSFSKDISTDDYLLLGTLALRSHHSLHSALTLLNQNPMTILDLNIRLNFWSKDLIVRLLNYTNILKINDDEAELLNEIFNLEQGQLYHHLHSEYNIEIIIQTLGSKGAEVSSTLGIIKHRGYPIIPVDTVGSGDSFLASFLFEYLNKKPLESCLDKACLTGAYVATQKGAIPVINENVLSQFRLQFS